MRFIVSALVLFFVCAFWMSVPTGCANIIPPSGGPRDSIPPVFMKATPPDSTVNFKTDRITLAFNEDVDLKDISSNVVYSPTFQKPPTLMVKGKTVIVKFTDTLSPKTTYILNFGNAITDFTEGNPVRNFSYVFSTGAFLDSLGISGRVVNAQDGSVDTTMVVVLHNDLRDTAVSSRPEYIAKIDRGGSFNFRNLPPDTFAIYAVPGGQGAFRTYQPGNAFAFYNTPVAAGTKDSIVLYAYKDVAQTTLPASSPVPGPGKIAANDRRLRLIPPTQPQQDLFKDYVLTFPIPLKTFDSSKIQLTTDSTFTPATFTSSLDSLRKALAIKAKWKEATNYHLILQKDFAADTAGRQLLKADTISFATKKKEDYGSLALRFKNIDSTKNPVVQFVKSGEVVFSASVKSGILNEPFFEPGEYNLRILFDTNGNGKWDPGKFFGKEKRQPELVRPIERTITVKPNWDNEFDILL